MSGLGLFMEPKNIIELFTFDLTTFFYEDDYEEISSHEKDGVFMIEYEKALPWIELGLFQSVVFRVFNDKNNIIGSNHINVRLSAPIDENTHSSVVKLVHKLTQIYGSDDDNQENWTDKDAHNMASGCLKRQWTLGEGKYMYTVRLSAGTQLLKLEVLFFNHLLELIK